MKEIKPHHQHISFLLIITILLIIALLILIKPALLGYKINKQFEDVEINPSEFLKSLESLKSKVLITETNLDSCKSLNEEFGFSLSKEKNVSLECLREKSSKNMEDSLIIQELRFNLSKLDNNLDQQKRVIELGLKQEEEKNERLEKDYELLLLNSANNICCKARVDDKKIDSYIVSSNFIVCTSDGENKIIC